ncbi:hypothetical protein CC85DRAFT_286277 [Cutaneotrichosporon oleaginosum]|uniref:Uncharacterized protein n=1 Tax=Cutaneotrichosporon oleaginosum TaxID=879819 RepID=A0A0J0XKN4_9TREE|nr:uncharacterized protein CC85DRAFT_286277 [Cutaneotrichosporon oleaginosum]KLT41622.1 hypothetical protein CC85DRAFT_286277 [Cutaneotrichosporon oleaginosum]TXT08139.1 hypothetical protein COLE_05063 [Cutaneotrichosporon oleaginosum]
MPILRKLFGAGLAGAAGAGSYIAYLTHKYPLAGPSAYHLTPEMLASYLDGQGRADVVYARVRNPSAAQAANARDAGVRAFFSCWALQLEGALFGHEGIASPLPLGADPAWAGESYLHGFFRTLHKSPESVVLFFSFPGRGAPVLRHATKGRIPQGTQVVSALQHPDGSGDLEIAYGCAQYREPYGVEDGPVMSFLHHTYMRYLIERMRANMQREANAAK